MKTIRNRYGLEFFTEPTEIILHSIPEDGPIKCPICDKEIWDEDLVWEDFDPCIHLEASYSVDEAGLFSGADDSVEALYKGIKNLSSQFNLYQGRDSAIHEWQGGCGYEKIMMTMLSTDKRRKFLWIDDHVNVYFQLIFIQK